MVNASFNLAAIAGIIGLVSSIYCYQIKIKFRRITGNESADLVSAFLGPLLVLPSSLIMFFQGWRLDPLLQASFLLLLSSLIYETWYSCRVNIGDAYSRITPNEIENINIDATTVQSQSHDDPIIDRSDKINLRQSDERINADTSNKNSSINSISVDLSMLNRMLESGELAEDEYKILRERVISGGND